MDFLEEKWQAFAGGFTRRFAGVFEVFMRRIF
jgi:hypothetical protein